MHDLPDPEITAENKAFWVAAGEGRLLVKQCGACGRHHHYPRAICPFCWSCDTVWQEASGRGTIYSFSVLRRAAEPYVIAYVTLGEGPAMMTNIVDCDPDALRCGEDVTVAFTTSRGGHAVPVFRPAADRR
jgi:hypothetical protein